jgi:hypothetical protein
MHRPHTKKITIAITAAALALSLTSCGYGPNAATRLIKRVTDGAEATVTTNGSNLSISNLLLVATEDGSAVVVGTIVNYMDEADALLGISAAGTTATLTGEQNLLRDKPVRFEGETANAKAVFAGVGAQAGRNVELQLAFARAGVVAVNVIIRDKRDDYANVTP